MSSICLCYTGPMARVKRSGIVKRVTLDLPEDLYERLRDLSYERRDSMNKIAIEVLATHLPEPQLFRHILTTDKDDKRS